MYLSISIHLYIYRSIYSIYLSINMYLSTCIYPVIGSMIYISINMYLSTMYVYIYLSIHSSISHLSLPVGNLSKVVSGIFVVSFWGWFVSVFILTLTSSYQALPGKCTLTIYIILSDRVYDSFLSVTNIKTNLIKIIANPFLHQDHKSQATCTCTCKYHSNCITKHSSSNSKLYVVLLFCTDG